MADVELTAAQVRDLQAIEQAVIQLRGTIERAERAGIDVTELRTRLDDAERRRVGLLSQFSPGVTQRRGR